MNHFISKSYEADGIILGSPTYVSNVSTEVKAYIDRCNYVNRANDGLILKGKVGTPVTIAARSGATFVYSAINFFFGISEMIISTSDYWNNAFGSEPGNIMNDKYGINSLRKQGQNMADLIIKLNTSK